MDTSPLDRLIINFQTQEKEIQPYVDALKDAATRWKAISSCFSIHSEQFNDFIQEFPDLESRLEVNEASECDSIIAELDRYFLLYENSLKQNRATLNRFKDIMKSKPLDIAYSFPPSPNFISEAIERAASMIETVDKQINCRKLALYELRNVESSVNPDSILRLVEKWNQFSI